MTDLHNALINVECIFDTRKDHVYIKMPTLKIVARSVNLRMVRYANTTFIHDTSQGRIQKISREGAIRNKEALHPPTCWRPHPPTS